MTTKPTNVTLQWSSNSLAYVLVADGKTLFDRCGQSIAEMRRYAELQGVTVTEVIPCPVDQIVPFMRELLKPAFGYASAHGEAGLSALRRVVDEESCRPR